MRKETKIIVQKNVDYRQIILLELKEKSVYQARIADLYACVIALDNGADVKEVNFAIIKRWSESGLNRVKELAWKLIENPDVLWYKQ